MILALGGKTNDVYLMPLLRYKELAPLIYNATGVHVTAFDIDEISDEWIDAVLAVEVEVPRKKAIIELAKQGKSS